MFQTTDRHRRQYAERLTQLGQDAIEDGFTLSQISVAKFFVFLEGASYSVRKAGLALGSGSNLNSIWVSDDRQTRLSVEIFEDGDIEYALASSDGSISIGRVSPERFWAEHGERFRDFLAT